MKGDQKGEGRYLRREKGVKENPKEKKGRRDEREDERNCILHILKILKVCNFAYFANDMLICTLYGFNGFPHLSIKRISLQLIYTLKVMSVALRHYQTVLVPFEEVSLIKHLVSALSEVPLSLHIDIGTPFINPPKSCCFLLISVEIDNQRKPE